MHERVWCSLRGGLSNDFRIARKTRQHDFGMRACQQCGASIRDDIRSRDRIVCHGASRQLFHDARDARVRVLDVEHRILVGLRLSEFQIEIERLIVAAH